MANAQAPNVPEQNVLEQNVLEWNEGWSQFDWPHAITTLAAGGAALTLWLTARPTVPHWTGINDFDQEARSALVLHTYAERETVATVSDVVFISMLAFPIVFDSVLMVGVVGQHWDLALQTALISTEALAYAFLFEVLSRQAARERPYIQECASDPSWANGCEDIGGYGRNTSFAAGHTLMSFASAGVTCANHTNLRFYGADGADAATCVSAIAIATGVAAARMSADRHWLTDNLAGAGLGLVAGWLLPVLLHYHPWAGNVRVVPGSAGAEWGLSIIGDT